MRRNFRQHEFTIIFMWGIDQAMETIEQNPPAPVTLAGTLRDMDVGATLLFESSCHSMAGVRSTLTRIVKAHPGRRYTSRDVGIGIRVWRLT